MGCSGAPLPGREPSRVEAPTCEVNRMSIEKLALCLVSLVFCVALAAGAGDWPMWRFDAGRTAASPDELPSDLYLQWVLELAPPAPAWPSTQNKLQFDASYEPVVMGTTVFVASMVHDGVTAYDTETGDEQWRFYTDGPVRLAPACANGKVYISSDDGSVYCLDAATGALAWRFCGIPSNRKVLGNKRIISMWPARGGPVLRDGTVYFAASIWPFMGIFVYALDAETGQVVWSNTGDGCRWTSQQHSTADAFATVAPQGHLVATEDILLVSGGRTVPAAFDRATGEYLYFDVDDRTWNRDQGGYAVAAIRDWFFCGPGHRTGNHPGMYQLADGAAVEQTRASVLTEDVVYEISGSAVRARDLTGASPTLAEVWSLTPSDAVTAVFCKAGSRLYAGGPDHVIAIEDLGSSGVERWNETIAGTPTTMLAADDKLFVATEEGYLYCFGEDDTGASLPSGPPPPIEWPPDDEWTVEAASILAETGVGEGYCLVLGLGTGRLAEELVRQSDLCVVGLDRSEATIEGLRTRWEDMGVPGERLSAFAGDVCTVQMPQYPASLIVSEDPVAGGMGNGLAFLERMFATLRPYGGLACFPASAQTLFDQGAASGTLANAEAGTSGSHAILTRVGALPDSADWTHQYADAGNTVTSKDALVKAPLGLLWFGGSSHTGILPRHGHGPSEQIVDGRLFIEGVDMMRAMDVYTGRVLWEKPLPGVGYNYDNTSHEPGANHIGSNYATAPDALYVAYNTECLKVDPASGATAACFTLPDNKVYGQIKVWEDLLVIAADPNIFDGDPVGQDNWNGTCSNDLFVMDRDTGEIAWARTAANAFHHNTIIAGNDVVYCIDRLPPGYEEALNRRGLTPADVDATYTLLALDARTGEEVWSTTENVFGTWLGYSADYGILLQSGRPSRDMVFNEPFGRLITYNAADGAVLWDKVISPLDQGPYILHGTTIFTQADLFGGGAYDLLSGEIRTRDHPLTGEPIPWHFSRTYGCNTAIACQNLLTFRSGAAGFYDLSNNGGTGNLGGFKSGCTSNLIAANGVLNAPDYTRTCTCSYQNQTSLAFVHMPEVEVWTYAVAHAGSGPVEQVGINFGAPGDRVGDNGLLWLDYPSVGSTSPDVDVLTDPANPEWFRHHSGLSADHPLRWAAASGAIGLSSITVTLGNAEEKPYVIRLCFAEPEDIAAGQRVFSVQLQGSQVLADFDIVQAAGGARSTVVREFTGVHVADTLEVALAPSPSSPIQEPVLCGIAALVDTDNDRLCDLEEGNFGTDSESADTDGDGVRDYDEVWYDGDAAYDPYNPATNPTGTDLDANNPDSDGDGVNDGLEVRYGTDPLSAADTPALPFGRLATYGALLALLVLASAAIMHRRGVRTRAT